MMKSSFSAIRLVVLLSFVAPFLTACGDVGNKIAKYADKGTNTITRLEQEQVITKDDADRIRPLISDVRAAGVEYAAIEQAVRGAKDATEKQRKHEQLAAAGRQIIASLQRLNDEGVLR